MSVLRDVGDVAKGKQKGRRGGGTKGRSVGFVLFCFHTEIQFTTIHVITGGFCFDIYFPVIYIHKFDSTHPYTSFGCHDLIAST